MYEHLRWILHHNGVEDLSPVIGILDAILQANIPDQIRATLRITTLLGIHKESGGVRPLSLSDILRRILGKAIATAYKSKWKDAVGIHQYGIGTTAGVEAVQNGTKLYLQLKPNSSAFLGDGVNAFNTCDRQSFINELHSVFPELSPFFEQWYVVESPLCFFLEMDPSEQY